MTQKEQILQLILKEKQRNAKERRNIFTRFFTTKGDKRWFDGRFFALEELECLIESQVD